MSTCLHVPHLKELNIICKFYLSKWPLPPLLILEKDSMTSHVLGKHLQSSKLFKNVVSLLP